RSGKANGRTARNGAVSSPSAKRLNSVGITCTREIAHTWKALSELISGRMVRAKNITLSRFSPAKCKASERPMPETKNKDLQAYRDCIERMNAEHAILMLGGKCVVINEVIDPAFNRPDVTFSGL